MKRAISLIVLCCGMSSAMAQTDMMKEQQLEFERFTGAQQQKSDQITVPAESAKALPSTSPQAVPPVGGGFAVGGAGGVGFTTGVAIVSGAALAASVAAAGGSSSNSTPGVSGTGGTR